MRRGLMQRMRGYARVVLMPVAATFLLLGQQIACASPADLDPAFTAAPTIIAHHVHGADPPQDATQGTERPCCVDADCDGVEFAA